MLSVLDRYESSNLQVIGTLKGLYPKKAIGGNIKQTYRDLAEKLTGSLGEIVNSQQLSAT
jgi:hypothetical protein